jgi:5-methylcytosine-specific restriction endonuclease McrA
MFLPNKYTTIYFSIIHHASTRSPIKKGERHHIIPKSLGGTNEKINLVLLTYREHFLCHILLTKMVEGTMKAKMVYALWRMSQCNSSRGICTSRQFSYAREQFIETIKKRKVSAETRKKIGDNHRGVKKPYAKNSFKGRKLSTSYWQITLPNNHVFVIENLHTFCKEHRLSMGNLSHHGHTKGYRATKLGPARNERLSEVIDRLE